MSMACVPSQIRCEFRRVSSVSRTRIHCGPLGNLQLQQLFDGQAVAEVVGHRAEVVDAVGQRNDLLVELGFAGLFDAGVQVADFRIEADNDLAVDFEHEAQHAVGRWMLRPHVEDHVLVFGSLGSRSLRGWECLRFRSSAIALHRVVLAQGMSLPVFGHQDAAQVGVSFEANAKEVEDFALVVVGARPDRGNGLDRRIGTGDEGSQADALLIRVRKNVVAQLEARLRREPVDRRHVFEEVVAGRLARSLPPRGSLPERRSGSVRRDQTSRRSEHQRSRQGLP